MSDKIAAKILKIANHFQTKNNFNENSTWSSFKCQNTQIQVKKFQYTYFENTKVLQPNFFIFKLNCKFIWSFWRNDKEFYKFYSIFEIILSEIIFIGKVSRSIDFSSLFYVFAVFFFETLHSINNLAVKLFRFSYKIAKTSNSETALTSDDTWIWKLKFGLRVQNEWYSILFTHIFDFETHVSG